ncbi:hypothetical protein ACWC9F_20895 [Streptomyces sp. NPDC001110]|uniref:hypothetical protein n=1 Tax=Streptomyces TaxID=1883 RepID=UPI0004BE3622|nr:hypothetical protein [[Kitasatospora] papulosa]
MTDSTPSEPTADDGEPTSFRERAKDWAEKHPRTIRVAKTMVMTAGVAAGVAVAVMVFKSDGMAQDEAEDAEEGEAQEPSSAPEAASQTRQSYPDPARDPFLRRLPPGQQASPEARERYRELTDGEELPDGYTLVSRWLYETAA